MTRYLSPGTGTNRSSHGPGLQPIRIIRRVVYRMKSFATATVCVLVAFSAQQARAQSTLHLNTAQAVVAQMRAQGETGEFFDDNNVEYNKYGASWSKSLFVLDDPAYVHAQCSSFFTHVMMASYPGWTGQSAGFGSASPTAAEYHDAIEAGVNGFRQVKLFANIRPGDILAAKYFDGSANTGHVMIVNDAIPGTPDANGITRWSVQVIDCSSGIHSSDSRVFLESGYVSSGAGIGWMYVYTKSNHITGYSWSQANGSRFYRPAVRHLILGRLSF